MRSEQISIRLSPDILEKLTLLAKTNKRKRNDQLNLILEDFFLQLDGPEKGGFISDKIRQESQPISISEAR